MRPVVWVVSLMLLVGLIPSAHAVLYSVTAIGTLPGGTFSIANAINNSGEIVGQGDNNAAHNDVFSLSGGVMTDTGIAGEALGVNDSGQIVGKFGGPGERAFSYTTSSGATDLGTLGGPIAVAIDVNTSGVVVGGASINSSTFHAFSYTSAGGMVDISGGASSRAFGINNSNQIAGDFTNGLGQNHAFSYSGGVMTDLGTLGGTFSTTNVGGDGAKVINNSGEIVGGSNIAGDSAKHAFAWTSAGGMIDLGTLGGTISEASGINDNGDIVGDSRLSSVGTHAFIYTGGVMIDLNTVLDSSGAGWSLQAANAINNSGLIIGTGTFGGNSESFLLTPILESNSVAMLVGGLGLLGFVVRRKRA